MWASDFRRRTLVALPLLIVCGSGCAVSLDGPTPKAPTTTAPAPSVEAGCLLFARGNPQIGLLQGAGISTTLADGSTLWLFSGTAQGTDSLSNGALAQLSSGASAADCFPTVPIASRSAFAPSPIEPDGVISPLDVVRVGDKTWAYYQLFALDAAAAFGVRSMGFGVAPWNPDGGQFVPSSELLWSGDSVPFGTSALVDDSDGGVDADAGVNIYVYGCGSLKTTQPSACYVARVESETLDDPSTYLFWSGADHFSSDVSEAAPIFDGVNSVNVRRHASGRILATYVEPLGSTLEVRSALTPTGPFSKEYDLATCQLGENDFCSGAVQHPELDADDKNVSLSYAATTFASESSGGRYWPRLITATLPDELP
jgi:hypothetical protein